MRKLLWALLVLLALGAVGGMVWEPLVATEYKAPPSREYDVEIARDSFGVPHINGKTDADTAYGLAYAHAEDDFSTIEDVVAMTRGRYGALAGSDGAKVDFVLHLLGARETAERRYLELSPQVRAVAEAYAAGLNHYADKHPDEVRLSKLFPVTGQDIVTGFVLRAPFFYGLDGTIGALAEGKPQPRESAARMTPIGRDPEMNGSNAFAIAPKRMADGKTWLISNSHQPYEGQVAWYEAAAVAAQARRAQGHACAAVLTQAVPRADRHAAVNAVDRLAGRAEGAEDGVVTAAAAGFAERDRANAAHRRQPHAAVPGRTDVARGPAGGRVGVRGGRVGVRGGRVGVRGGRVGVRGGRVGVRYGCVGHEHVDRGAVDRGAVDRGGIARGGVNRGRVGRGRRRGCSGSFGHRAAPGEEEGEEPRGPGRRTGAQQRRANA